MESAFHPQCATSRYDHPVYVNPHIINAPTIAASLRQTPSHHQRTNDRCVSPANSLTSSTHQRSPRLSGNPPIINAPTITVSIRYQQKPYLATMTNKKEAEKQHLCYPQTKTHTCNKSHKCAAVCHMMEYSIHSYSNLVPSAISGGSKALATSFSSSFSIPSSMQRRYA